MALHDHTRYLKNALKASKSNWYLPLSGMAFLLLEVESVFGHFSIPALVIAFAALMILSGMRENLFLETLLPMNRVRFAALLSSIGIVGYGVWYGCFQYQGRFGILVVAGCLSVPFVYSYSAYILDYVWNRLLDDGWRDGMGRAERSVYIALFVLSSAVLCLIYLRTEAFCGTDVLYDVVYNSDSPILFTPNAELFLGNIENDIRQPLFGVFASPLAGIFFLIGFPLSFVHPRFLACTVGILQVGLLLFSHLLIAKSLRLNPVQRIFFTLFFCSSTSYLLFSLMYEQYVVAFFWLSVCILQLSKGRQDVLAWTGATGTLLTSGALILYYIKSDKWSLKEAAKRVCICVGHFLFFCAVFGRLHVFFDFLSHIGQLNSRFSGGNVLLKDRAFQYTHFVRGIFFGFPGFADVVTRDHISWQSVIPNGLSVTGICLILFAFCGAVMGRRKISVRIAGLWMLMSFVLLCVIGWGTAENGLVLYSLYFGWPFILLIFTLLEWVGDRLKAKWFVPAAVLIFSSVCLYFGICQILQIVQFGIQWYPV